MRIWFNCLIVLGGLTLPYSARATLDQSLPPVEEIIERALKRGEAEAENERLFNQNYYYVRSRQTEIRNADGDVKKLKSKISTNAPSGPSFAPESDDLLAGQRPSPQKETDPQKPGKFSKDNLKFSKEAVQRYDFKLVGREITNGCSLLVLDFAPKQQKLPEKDLRDRVVNRMAGRIWLDEREYAVKKCALRLTKSLSVVGGIVGEAHKFFYTFDRDRTDDGLWYVRESNWYLKGRQVLVQREADYQEKRTDVRKLH